MSDSDSDLMNDLEIEGVHVSSSQKNNTSNRQALTNIGNSKSSLFKAKVDSKATATNNEKVAIN